MQDDQVSSTTSSDLIVTNDQNTQPATKNVNRITSPLMTKYEKTRIIGMRAMQLSMNAPPLIEIEDETDALRIAEKEFYAKKIPFIIRRRLPDNTYEDWKINELVYPDERINFSKFDIK